MSSIIFEALPYSVRIGETDYKIDADFRLMAKYEQSLLTGDRGDKEAMTKIIVDTLFCWLGNQLPKVEQLNEAIDKMWWFYRCGEPLDSRINSSGTKHTKRLYDYDIDSALIVSAFADTYGIDLVSSKMHWWQFKAYFAGLNESTRFVKVMSYRGMDLSQFKGKMRSFYADMQKMYALPEVHQTPMTLKERDEQFKKRMMQRATNRN